MYLSQDPIRIESGLINFYSYVKDTNHWIDVFGLNAKPETAFEFETRISRMSPQDRVTAVKGKAEKVARKNGWEKDSRLSRQNDRIVYKDADGKLYSVDTQHGRFEYFDSKGGHMGEFDIDGKQTKPADISGGHNLRHH